MTEAWGPRPRGSSSKGLQMIPGGEVKSVRADTCDPKNSHEEFEGQNVDFIGIGRGRLSGGGPEADRKWTKSGPLRSVEVFSAERGGFGHFSWSL